MNNDRSAQIRKAISLLETAAGIIDDVSSDEEDAMSGMEGTNLKSTDRYASMEAAVNALQDAQDSIGDVISCLEDIL